MSNFKLNVNASKSVGMDGVFLGLAGLLLGISLGLRPREIPWSSQGTRYLLVQDLRLSFGQLRYKPSKLN